LIRFSQDAERVVESYLQEAKSVLATFGAKPEYLQMLIFDLEHYLRFFSIKDARKRGLSIVDVTSVENVIRHFGKPERFARSEFKDAATLDMVQSARLSLFDSIKKSIEESQNPKVLDAGCDGEDGLSSYTAIVGETLKWWAWTWMTFL
jgi:hypothetical protein